MPKRQAVFVCCIGACFLFPFAGRTEEAAPAFGRQMLAAHNAIRQKMGVPALKWSGQLAAQAEAWAQNLAATGASKMQGIPGQNIAYTSPAGRVKAADVVAAWAAESGNYSYDKNACIDPGRRCNHYTQVIWKKTAYLGCATAHDTKRDIWVCDYDPPGNNIAEKPF